MIRSALVLCSAVFLAAGFATVAAAQEELPRGLPAASSPDDNALGMLSRANQLLESGEQVAAIELYGAALSSATTDETRRRVYLSRAHALLTQDPLKNLELALADRSAGGEPGIPLRVVRTAPLKIKADAVGQVSSGETVQVERLQGEWVWVTAVSGDSQRRGWLQLTAFQSPPSVGAATTAIPAPQVQTQRYEFRWNGGYGGYGGGYGGAYRLRGFGPYWGGYYGPYSWGF